MPEYEASLEAAQAGGCRAVFHSRLGGLPHGEAFPLAYFFLIAFSHLKNLREEHLRAALAAKQKLILL